MATIGILPALEKKPFMLERLARETGLVRVSGQYTHLVLPGQKVKTERPSIRHTNTFNGGGDAA